MRLTGFPGFANFPDQESRASRKKPEAGSLGTRSARCIGPSTRSLEAGELRGMIKREIDARRAARTK